EKGLGQRQGQPAQLEGDGTDLAGQLLPAQGVENGAATFALVARQGIGEDPDEFGEGRFMLATGTARAVEGVVQHGVGGNVAPQAIERLGQGQAAQNLKGEGGRLGLLVRRQDHGYSSISSWAMMLYSAQDVRSRSLALPRSCHTPYLLGLCSR